MRYRKRPPAGLPGVSCGSGRLLEVAGDVDDDVGARSPAAADDESDLALRRAGPEADYPASRERRYGADQLIVERPGFSDTMAASCDEEAFGQIRLRRCPARPGADPSTRDSGPGGLGPGRADSVRVQTGTLRASSQKGDPPPSPHSCGGRSLPGPVQNQVLVDRAERRRADTVRVEREARTPGELMASTPAGVCELRVSSGLVSVRGVGVGTR
jgi:hypothetical protein